MTFRSDPLFEMLDTATADRMLDGAVLPGDAPPGYKQVALLLSALSEPRSAPAAVAAAPRMAARPGISRRRRRPALVATVVAAAILSSAMGAAYANILPDAIGRPLHQLIQHIRHPSSTAERHTPTVTTPPAGTPVDGPPRRQTAAQRSHDRPRRSTPPSATTPPPTSRGESSLHAQPPAPPASSRRQPAGRRYPCRPPSGLSQQLANPG